MKLRNKLKNIDSKQIEKEFPADWDMDKIFNSSYKKYLSMKKDSGISTEKSNFKVSSVENVSHESRIRHILFNTMPIAACFAVIWGMSKLIAMTPIPVEYDSRHDETDTMPPLYEETTVSAEHTEDITENESEEFEYIVSDGIEEDTIAVPQQNYTESDRQEIISLYEPPADTETEDISELPVDTVTDDIPQPPADTETDDIPQLPADTETEDISEPPADTITDYMPEPPALEITETIEKPSYEPIPDDTEEEPIGLAPSDNTLSEKGHFVKHDPDYNSIYPYITYVPSSSASDTEKIEHNVIYDGFTTELISDVYNITSYRLTDDSTGQVYILTINKFYDWFIMSYNTDYNFFLSIFELNSRSAFYLYQDDEEKLGVLGFDDGCHVVTITSQHKDYNTMFYLAQNFN